MHHAGIVHFPVMLALRDFRAQDSRTMSLGYSRSCNQSILGT
jgi:hypothetical protein